MTTRQRWTIERVVNPNDLPVSPREVKQQLNLPVDFEHHDEKLIDYIGAATERFESDTDCVCIDSVFALYLDYLPDEPINLYKRPVTSIESIECYDADGVPFSVDPAVYRLSTARRQVSTAPGQTWPAYETGNEAVKISFRAGAASPLSVPRLWRQAVSLGVGNWFLDPTDARARDQWKTSYDAIARRFMSVNEI